MTVAAELENLRDQIRALSATRCAGCGHEYRMHAGWLSGRCAPVLKYGAKADPSRCGCRRFVDPSETLEIAAGGGL